MQSIAINYPAREISFAWMEWNWIVLFFVVSLIAVSFSRVCWEFKYEVAYRDESSPACSGPCY